MCSVRLRCLKDRGEAAHQRSRHTAPHAPLPSHANCADGRFWEENIGPRAPQEQSGFKSSGHSRRLVSWSRQCAAEPASALSSVCWFQHTAQKAKWHCQSEAVRNISPSFYSQRKATGCEQLEGRHPSWINRPRAALLPAMYSTHNMAVGLVKAPALASWLIGGPQLAWPGLMAFRRPQMYLRWPYGS